MTRSAPWTAAARSLVHLHESERLVAWAQTPRGRGAVWALAAVLLASFSAGRIILPFFTLTVLLPQKRRLVLAWGALAAAVLTVCQALGISAQTLDATAALTVLAAGLILFSALFVVFLAARHFHRLPRRVQRAPQLWLHLLVWAALGALLLRPAGTPAFWSAVGTAVATALPFLVWRCGYMLKAGQRGTAASSRFRDHLYYLWPVFGGSNVPQGKGFDHLSDREARSPQALARSQLAGIKLLGLACLWKGCRKLMNALVFGDPDSLLAALTGGFGLGIPRAGAMMSAGADLSVGLSWVALYAELVRITLWLAIWGHVIVASLRLCGFNVFRNTYKPLLAESILDFWNRFYYYFKELLVEFFFYPTYLRTFRKQPKLRMFTAIFAAAFAGNVYYHVLADRALIRGDFRHLGEMLESYILYCLLLASGVTISMFRQQSRRGQGRFGESDPEAPPRPSIQPLLRLRRIAGVWTFYSLIHIWDSHVNVAFLDRARFFLSLFGLENLLPPT